MHIVGTAGHVDHGKSSLVAALTGTNPDRWLEERLRGMTLDLGFAHLVLDGGIEAGIVDVPGHERFLHNMLAGAAGMDVLLLAIDANEGVMPQTREHLDILRYLNVRRTIVALTKIDLLTDAELAGAREAIAGDLRDTIAENAPVLGVSSHTGAGLDDLRAALAQTLASLTPRDAEAPLYLPVDRVFALPGLGTVVTGTLMQGRIRPGDSVTFAPSGNGARIRSLHVFGKQRDVVDAGSRVALNVPAIDRHDVRRGEAVVGREFSGRTNLDVKFTPLPGAMGLLQRRTAVHAYVGSAEVLGTLLLDGIPEPNEEMHARLVLRSPVVAFPGVRYVVRRLSPHALLGGGFVEGIESNAPSDGAATPAELAITAVLAKVRTEAIVPGDIAVAANVREDVVAKLLGTLVERGDAMRVQRPVAYVDAGAAREYLNVVNAHLEELHRAEPWAMGATSVAIARATGKTEALAVRLLSAFAEEGRISNRGGYYAAVGFTPALTVKQREFFDALVKVDANQPFVPVPFDEVASEVRKAQLPGTTKAFDTLLARGVLIKVGDFLYRGSQIAQVQARVEQFLLRAGKMTASEFRDLLGTSRKYAVPLLEWLDARGITLRSGDYRMLRKRGT